MSSLSDFSEAEASNVELPRTKVAFRISNPSGSYTASALRLSNGSPKKLGAANSMLPRASGRCNVPATVMSMESAPPIGQPKPPALASLPASMRLAVALISTAPSSMSGRDP